MRRKIAIFDVLGVRPEDDLTTIRAAWRRKAKELHPDLAADKKAAGEKLARINAAFADLKTHTPFAERRRANRRKARRDGRWWRPDERADAARKNAAARRARAAEARRRADAEAEAEARQRAAAPAREKQQAAYDARKQAAARKAAQAEQVRVKRMSPEERQKVFLATLGYTAIRRALST